MRGTQKSRLLTPTGSLQRRQYKNSQMEEIHRVSLGEGHGPSRSSLHTPPSQHLHGLSHQKALGILSFRGIVGGPAAHGVAKSQMQLRDWTTITLCRHEWVNHWPLGINSVTSPFPFPGGWRGRAESSKLPSFSCYQSHPEAVWVPSPPPRVASLA